MAFLLGVCLMAVLLRGVPTTESDNIYGFDPYVHHYYSWYTTEYGTFAAVDHFRDDVVDDRGNWPGLHLLAGGTVLLTGADMNDLYRYLPLVLGALVVMVLFLLVRRLYGLEVALFAALIFAVADYAVQMSTWLIPATVGLLIYTTFLAVIVNMRVERRSVTLLVALLFAASLVTHHFTHLIFISTVLIAAVFAERRAERSRLMLLMVPMLLLTGAYWYWFGRQTGSFPDIAEHMAAIIWTPVGLIVIAALIALTVLAYLRYDGLSRGWYRMEERARTSAARIDGSPVLLAVTTAGVLLVTVVAIGLHSRAAEEVDGGWTAQVTKYALATLGWVGIVTAVSQGLPRVRLFIGIMSMLVVGYLLVLYVFTFLPLELRFFEFVYIPMAVMSGVGVVRLAHGLPGAAPAKAGTPRARAVPVAVTMAVVGILVIAMAADDHRRMTSDLSDRYYHSDAEIAAAEWVEANTEPNAVISTPFGLQPVIFGFGRRATDTDVIAHSVIEKNISAFAWDLIVVNKGRPHYIVLTTDTSKYGKDEYLELDLEEDIYEVGGGMLRTPRMFEFQYNNTEIVILKVTSNLTGGPWNSV
ncbi:MAG: hypothetical protein JSW25_08785 [Thermoplasmata archaeon]|nr:MAG: hypothetical protein JSW25_08785 [Thermoplasmata archaeon]